MSESHQWPDCGNVQCQQVHNCLDSLLDYYGAECPKDIYVVGKTVRLMDAIKARKQDPILSKEFVAYWQTLTFKQLTTLAAQSLLRAADKCR